MSYIVFNTFSVLSAIYFQHQSIDMQETQKEALVQKMHAEVTRLRDEVIRLKEVTKPVSPDASIGRLSRMDNIVNNSVNTAALAKAESRLAGLEFGGGG